MAKFWRVLKRPKDLKIDDTRPSIHIRDYQHSVAPQEQLDDGHMAYPMVNFLETDYRNYPTQTERIDQLAFYFLDEFIFSTLQFWKRIIFIFL